MCGAFWAFWRSALLASLALGALGCKSTLRAGLSEHEANQIALALERAHIAATKAAGAGAGTAGRFEVQVGNHDLARALAVLEHEALPPRAQDGFAELFEEPGLVATPAEERARWAAASAGELARSLERLAGVADARVHLALPEAAQALDRPARPAKASVLLRRRPGARPVDEAAVRALVAGAVEGLSAGAVTVVQTAIEPSRRPERALVHLGPISVTRGSAAALKAVLGSALLLDLALAVALVAIWRTRSRPA